MTPIKLLAHYCDDPQQRYVSELPGMEKPVKGFIGVALDIQYDLQIKFYEQHLSRLKKYAASWLTESMHNTEVECLLQWQVKRLTGDWEDCDRITFGWAHNHLEQRTRIIALPIEQSKGEEGEYQKGTIGEWVNRIYDVLDSRDSIEVKKEKLAMIRNEALPSTSPSAAGEDNNKLWDEVGEYLKKQSFIFPAIENLKSKFSITRK